MVQLQNSLNIRKSIQKIGFDVKLKHSQHAHAQTACHWEHVSLLDLLAAIPGASSDVPLTLSATLQSDKHTTWLANQPGETIFPLW